ncbi:type II secretion system protein J [Paenibacillus sp. N3.4]|uniref:PulJ/GspJ family protein n=1 Tax=Paenibacillus sp. N3.4 TaxID=2603222 RepID=UPI0011CB6513|nr:type II secretion system protein [Paenibacillus sp. N3.4]TXK85382.1 type II secretion system protein [Paenibacillus sp. N3.4]
MKIRKSREEGFTLIEVLAATVILSIVSMAMMAFFINAMSYNKGNQNKTVMVNLARNALFYMEKQNFNDLNAYFTESTSIQPAIDLNASKCTFHAGALTCSPEDKTLSSMTGLWNVLNTEVNGKNYVATIIYQKDLIEKDTSGKFKYLIPIKVTVRDASAPNGSNRNQANVEGYILDESIR